MPSQGDLVAYTPTATAKSPLGTFPGSLQDYFNDSTFSDVTVVCGDKEFRAHRLILSAHSRFFAKAFTGPWKESSEGKLALEEVEPPLVEAMLHFMYHSDYDVAHGASSMLFHAQIYGLADRYVIPSLKDCSERKFKTAISSGWQLDDFPLAIVEAYNSTPETDGGLRDAIVEVATQNVKNLVKNSLFEYALREKAVFAADMVNALSSDSKTVEKTKCPNCKKIVPMVFPKGSYYCMYCSVQRSDWTSYVVHE